MIHLKKKKKEKEPKKSAVGPLNPSCEMGLEHLVIFGLKNTLQVSFCLANKYCPQSLVHFSIRFLKIRSCNQIFKVCKMI